MGVPSFYRWLVNKYPKIVSDGEGHAMEFDNLYLDMNGIIHPCFHPENNLSPPTTFEEVFSSVYQYIDHLFDIAKPKKLLFMAIDGVAPRAKMNQQRARRFRAAKDLEMEEDMEEKLRKQFECEGKLLLPKEESQVADSNVITPGTEFMHVLSEKLRSYISRRMREDLAWGSIKVILSDDKAPGEGEHKIMSFIRSQRALPGYDSNTRHCLYGLDADLIMLALATHEIHFCILREEVLSPNQQTDYAKSSKESEDCLPKSRGWFKEKPSSEPVNDSEKLALCKEAHSPVSKRQPYQFLNVCILREYLALDLENHSSDNKLECDDLERIIDDFIFICFFAGNDFLPHMPTLEIHEGCIDLLMHVYKSEFQNLGGYLVNMQKVHDKTGAYIKLKRVEKFILAVGAYEDKIFSKRCQIRERKQRRILADFREAKEFEKHQLDEGTSSDIVGMHAIARLSISDSAVDHDTVLNNMKELKRKLKEYTRNQSDLFKDGCLGTDRVKLDSHGFRERYYEEKFSAHSPQEIEAIRKSVVAKYGEGLCWVLLYYFSGVPSWSWFYPYHHGPFASDFKGLSHAKARFQKDSPVRPFDQLMGVLPPRSAHALPEAFKGLMINENSSIVDFYPKEFETDVDGKRYAWQGICKLPFIEAERLLAETRKIEIQLKENEKIRNMHSLDRLFLLCTSETSLKSWFGLERSVSERIKGAITMESTIEGIRGTLHVMPEDLALVDDFKDGYSRNDLCVFYEIPQCYDFLPRLLEGVKIPEKTVYENDIQETTLWHEHRGSTRPSNVGMFHDQRTKRPGFEAQVRNPVPAFISKGAGEGFSCGRGKQSSTAGLERPDQFQKHNANRPVGKYRPQSSTSSSYRGYREVVYQPSSNPRPTYYGNNRPQSSTSSSYWGYGNVVHQPPSVPRPAYYGNNRPQSSTSETYAYFVPPNNMPQRGGGNFWRGNNRLQSSASETNIYFELPNNMPQRGGGNFWRAKGASEDWGMKNPTVAAPGASRRTQHPNGSFSADSGGGRGRGRGRGGFHANKP